MQKSRIDLNKRSGKNFLINKLVRPAYKIVKLVTRTISEVQKLKIYNKVLNNIVHGNKSQKVIDKNSKT